jgi:hypothetical protein
MFCVSMRTFHPWLCIVALSRYVYLNCGYCLEMNSLVAVFESFNAVNIYLHYVEVIAKYIYVTKGHIHLVVKILVLEFLGKSGRVEVPRARTCGPVTNNLHCL